MKSETMVARDLYLRHTKPTGEVGVTSHRVWDADKFLKAQTDFANSEAERDGVIPAKITVTTRDEYLRIAGGRQ